MPGYQDLLSDPFLQLCHMGNDPYQTLSSGQSAQGPDRLLQRFLIKRAKALIHKHGIQTDSPRIRLDLIREPKSQGKRRLEGFSSG